MILIGLIFIILLVLAMGVRKADMLADTLGVLVATAIFFFANKICKKPFNKF